MEKTMSDWIMRLRAKIGTELIFVNSACAWVENDNGQVLLQRREKIGDVWGLPGGVMDLGEAAHETAIREVGEETGLEVIPISLIGVYTKFFEVLRNGDQCQTVSFLYRMHAVSGNLTIDYNETFELRYFDPCSMPKLHTEQHCQMARDAIEARGTYFR